ncbi:Protein virC2 [Bienertia sinuspersici]
MVYQTLHLVHYPALFGRSSMLQISNSSLNSFSTFISNDSFARLANECPVSHISSFLEMCYIVKINNVSEDTIRSRLFPFSLRDRAREWFTNEGVSTFDTWDKLPKAFLVKFLGQEKTAKPRNELETFQQPDDESLYEAWRWFLQMQIKCPHYGIPKQILILTFYNGLCRGIILLKPTFYPYRI